MKIIAQTYFTPPMVVYDTEAPIADTGKTKLLKNIFRPVVHVQQGNTTLYKTGEFYNPLGFYILLGALFGVGAYITYRLVK